MIPRIGFCNLALLGLLAGTALQAAPDGAMIYADQCAACHGAGRLGGTGPALLPESLGRLTGEKLTALIAAGRPMTQMPAFKGTLSPADIAAVAAHV